MENQYFLWKASTEELTVGVLMVDLRTYNMLLRFDYYV